MEMNCLCISELQVRIRQGVQMRSAGYGHTLVKVSMTCMENAHVKFDDVSVHSFSAPRNGVAVASNGRERPLRLSVQLQRTTLRMSATASCISHPRPCFLFLYLPLLLYLLKKWVWNTKGRPLQFE